jgi:hypothetical protein
MNKQKLPNRRMNKKYVIQAFELNLKGRFNVLYRYYGDRLFELPAQIMVLHIKDELEINLTEQSIYNLKRKLKRSEPVGERESVPIEPQKTLFFGE